MARGFFALCLMVGLGLLVVAFSAGRREPDHLAKEAEKSASWLAQLVIGGVEHAMLQGEGIHVESLIERMEARAPEIDVAIFDQRGIRVFAPDSPVPDPATLPPEVRAILAGGQHTSGQHTSGRDGRIYRPLASEDHCQPCHDDGRPLRGVLALDLDLDRCETDSHEPVSRLIEEGFIHVMTAEREDLLDDYFRELVLGSPDIASVAVFDVEGERAYGDAMTTVSRDEIRDALQRRMVTDDVTLTPLPNQDRCVACHDGAIGEPHGVLVITFAGAASVEAPGQGDGSAAARDQCAGETIEQTIETSLRFIMRSRLGRRIADFLDRAAELAHVRELVLYDNVGRMYWTTDHPTPLPEVAEVIATRESVTVTAGAGEEERLRVVMPLLNGEGCVRCHGSSSTTRGAVAVSLSTAEASRARMEILGRRATFTSYVVLGGMLIFAAVLFFVRPRPSGPDVESESDTDTDTDSAHLA